MDLIEQLQQRVNNLLIFRFRLNNRGKQRQLLKRCMNI